MQAKIILYQREKEVDRKARCPWAGNTQIYMDYHDKEWGKPLHDESKLFEMFFLETMQAGLSWITILKKRESYREAFDNFNPRIIALYDDVKIEELLQNKGIIRNKLKIKAAIHNAQIFLKVQEKYGSFDKMIWSYVDNMPIIGHWEKIEDVPTTSMLSDKISKDLKKVGFKFIGSITVYAFMQAIGMLNDHLTSCFVYQEEFNTIIH